MAEPLLAAQMRCAAGAARQPIGRHVPHGAWRCAGDDAWISIAVGSEEEAQNLRAAIGAAVSKNALAAWLRDRSPCEAEAVLRRFGVAAAALASSVDLVASEHLRARGILGGAWQWRPPRSALARELWPPVRRRPWAGSGYRNGAH